MKYILKNIRSFARDYTKIFILLLITIAASTLIIHLSYGMFREYRDRRELSRSAANEIVFRLKSSYAQKDIARADNQMQTVGDLESQTYEKRDDLQDVTVADIRKFAKKADQEVLGKLLNIHTGLLEGEYRFETDFLIDHGSIVNSSEYGPDSFYGISASIIMSSTETIFYTLSVYSSAAGISKSRYTVLCAIIANVSGIAASYILTCIFFANN